MRRGYDAYSGAGFSARPALRGRWVEERLARSSHRMLGRACLPGAWRSTGRGSLIGSHGRVVNAHQCACGDPAQRRDDRSGREPLRADEHRAEQHHPGRRAEPTRRPTMRQRPGDVPANWHAQIDPRGKQRASTNAQGPGARCASRRRTDEPTVRLSGRAWPGGPSAPRCSPTRGCGERRGACRIAAGLLTTDIHRGFRFWLRWLQNIFARFTPALIP